MDSNPALPSGVTFREMSSDDVLPVLDIIRQHDEDDYDFARKTYQRDIGGHYVLDVRGLVSGVTGAQHIDTTDNTYGLSWTYLHTAQRGMGLGKLMIEQMVNLLRNQGARKIFVNTSDYVAPGRGEIYRVAHDVYRAIGFGDELKHPHYYDRNEALIALGYRVKQLEKASNLEMFDSGAEIVDVDEIPETDDAYYIQWETTDGPGATADDLAEVIRQVEKWEGRVIFVGIPSDATKIARLFSTSRFRQEGMLSDFFADGIHELHYRYDLV